MTEPYDPWSPERRAVVARLPQLAFLTVLVGPVFFAGALGLDGLGLWLFVFLVWLGAAIVYQTNRRWASGVHTGPGTIWQALSGLAAAALIVAGTFLAGGDARGRFLALVFFGLGVGIAGWTWSRVARASHETTTGFLGGLLGGFGGAGIGMIRGMFTISFLIALLLYLASQALR